MRNPRHSRGAALLSAMLTVALVATFAAAALWQQWRSIEVEAAERARVQSDWVLTGALDWARLILREDGKSGGADHLGEPWAVPLEEARLSSFLAADSNNNSSSSDSGAEVLDAFMSGRITDLQALLNVTDLVSPDGKTVSDLDVQRFARLFEQLGLPSAQVQTMAENLRFAKDRSPDNGSSPLAPLPPQRIEQLVWLGLPQSTVAALKPYVTVLPERTLVNLNTASAEVISAAVLTLSMADAQRLVAVRQRQPFRTLAEAEQAIGADAALAAQITAAASINTSFFEVRSRLRLDKLVVEERAVVQRRPGPVLNVLQRERVAPETPTEAADATRR